MKQKHTHTHTKCTQLQKMSLMRACSSGGPLREGNGDSWPGGVWHTLGVRVRVATVTTGFLKSFFPTKFLRGLSTFLSKMPGLLKRIFALFSFGKKIFWKNILLVAAHCTSEGTDPAVYWGQGSRGPDWLVLIPGFRQTWACVCNLWADATKVIFAENLWNFLQDKSSEEGERKSTGWPTANSGGEGPLWFRTVCSTNYPQPRPQRLMPSS